MITKLTSYLRFTNNASFTRSLRMSSVIGCVIILCSIQPSFSQVATASASFEDWSVFSDEVACWAASEAYETPETSAGGDGKLMFVTFFYGSQTPEISFNVGKCCGTSAYARANELNLPLIYEDEHYFPAVNEIDFLLHMLRGERLEIVDQETDHFNLWFSLFGFRDAYNHLAKTCDFRLLINMDEVGNLG
jgi:hypothetical protein